ncbi:MAG: hypothetical protein EAZ35_02355 [Sphingobacteriia bacterium]|nr:MAG: hypothetical protein EAZ35_02355 [Sphingobacteriia bacterium]
MTINEFNTAKNIDEKIRHMKVKKYQLEAMKKREHDEEFNLARQLAHDSLCYSISRLEQDFLNL